MQDMIKKSVIKGIPISKEEKKEIMEGKIKQGLLANLTRSLSLRSGASPLSPKKPAPPPPLQLSSLKINLQKAAVEKEKEIEEEKSHSLSSRHSESVHLSSLSNEKPIT